MYWYCKVFILTTYRKNYYKVFNIILKIILNLIFDWLILWKNYTIVHKNYTLLFLYKMKSGVVCEESMGLNIEWTQHKSSCHKWLKNNFKVYC